MPAAEYEMAHSGHARTHEGHLGVLAEGEGFEPPRAWRPLRFSRPLRSTTPASLRAVIPWYPAIPPQAEPGSHVNSDREFAPFTTSQSGSLVGSGSMRTSARQFYARPAGWLPGSSQT